MFVRHAIDDDDLGTLVDAVTDRRKVIERAERSIELNVFELELIGIVQHPAGLGIDAINIAARDLLYAGRESQCRESFARTGTAHEADEQGNMFAHSRLGFEYSCLMV